MTNPDFTHLLKTYEQQSSEQNAIELLLSLKNTDLDNIEHENLKNFLDVTGQQSFVKSIKTTQNRDFWAENVFKFIQKSNYSLLDMFKSRVRKNPDKTLFTEYIGKKPYNRSYKRIDTYTQEIAAALYKINEDPKVAIYCENDIDSACVDLACLFYDIFVSPLNVNFNQKIILNILKQINFNVFVADTQERVNRLRELRDKNSLDFSIITTNEKININNKNEFYLRELLTRTGTEETNEMLNSRNIKPINEVATVMFTSGSTGIPKGISFSIYNLVSKRFARGAALPDVGENEKLLCYLPLFHTFGRYLEMLGMIYWNGTYVFTGTHSKDTLFELFPIVKPTGFISIPLRWLQIYEKVMEKSEDTDIDIYDTLNKITGGNLKWGLSAAGYLDPKVFKFFHRNYIDLMSGFGMTEATGGVTMTPPSEYKYNSVGKPLPGVYLSFGNDNELLLKGHYIARYLDDYAPGTKIPYPHEDNYKLPTGDIFKLNDDGHYEIVDRVKDIYKNNKGQTVAPKNAENKFENVPGFKRAFLVGDGMPYNILFVVPDTDDEVFMSKSDETRTEYFRKIINEANTELEPYDRVVNFMILDRDFDQEKGELTAKGSFNRKTIEQNFENEIEDLYQKNYTDIKFDNFTLRFPRWFFRDLGIMEDDILFNSEYLYNRVSGKKLKVKINDPIKKHLQIGDLEYRILSDTVDLGRMALKPSLWIGNPQLIDFVPYKEGWETKVESIFEHVFLPFDKEFKHENEFPQLHHARSSKLNEVNDLICKSLFCDTNCGIEAIDKLSELLNFSEDRISSIIRKRLETLARHKSEAIRTKAYRTLLLDDPSPDYSRSFPAFIESGLSFLNNDSIREIAKGKLEKRRLEALRIRLRAYREQLVWDGEPARILQFENIMKLLSDFATHHPEFYAPVRYEFADWILFNKEKQLSEIAKKYFRGLSENYEINLDKEDKDLQNEFWSKKIIFDDDIEDDYRSELMNVFNNTAFIRQSIMLAFDEPQFKSQNIIDDGIWISKLDRTTKIKHYRLSITTLNNKHFELQVYIHDAADLERNLESVYWHISIAGHPYSSRVLPRFGVCRPELNIRSSVYNSELNVWDKLREFSSQRIAGMNFSRKENLHRIFVEAISTYIKAWDFSGRRILPGKLLPENLIISELDFRDGGVIHSLKNWKEYNEPKEFILSIYRNFYKRSIAHYKWLNDQIDTNWIFYSFREALGEKIGIEVLKELKFENSTNSDESEIAQSLNMFIEENQDSHYIPLKIINAIRRYKKWKQNADDPSKKAQYENLLELHNLYNLNKVSDYLRYYLFRSTYFVDFPISLIAKFDELLKILDSDKDKHATELIELSELRNMISDEHDKKVFSKMVFPELKDTQNISVNISEENRSVIISSYIKDAYDNAYTFRPPINTQEIGQLYRIFFQDKFPKEISELDKFYVAVDEQERIIGGICYKIQDKESIFIDGTVVVPKLKGRGIGSAMLEDFCGRIASDGFSVCKTFYFMEDFYGKRGFKLDKAWGAMVRFLSDEESVEITGQYCRI